jgi:PAS domain S-box-containing protein
VGTDISDQKHVRELLRDHKPVISDVFHAVEGFDSVALHVPIFKGSVFKGSIGILINFESIANRYLDVIKIGKTGYAWVVSRDGTQLYSPIPGFTGKSVFKNVKDFPSLIVMVNDMLKGHEGTYTFDKIGDRNVGKIKKYAVYMPVQVGNTFWSIVVASGEQEVLFGLTSFRNKLALVLGALFIFGMVFSTLGAKAWFIVREEEKRKQTEKQLRESEERLRDITFSMADWVWEVDEKGVYTYSSSKGNELLGNVIGKTPFDFMPPDEAKRVAAIFSEIAANNLPIKDLENWNITRSGERICFLTNAVPILDEEGNLKGYRGVDKDITARKQMEMQLSESQTLLSSLFNSTSDLIWSVDPERFSLTVFNSGLTEYFLHGTGLHIKAGMTPDDMLPKEFAQQWHMFYRRALEEGSFITDYQASTQGRTLRLNLNILKRDDVVFGISVFAQDFTSRKKLEHKLSQSLEEVQGLRDQLQMENRYLREQIKRDDGHVAIVGDSNSLLNMLANAKKVAPTDSTVLLLGETGTGKELLAHAIHEMSTRKDRMLVIINCASLPPTLIESELFGREKGAYTGSLTKMAGRFELAEGSTLFLDEIGDLPLELQSKLLRVLEQGQFERLGSTKTITVNVRVIAATNRDLEKDVKEGKFRSDLYYRLNVFPITIPPLRDRKEDIPSLVWSFVKQFEKSLGKRIDSIPKKQMESLTHYSWPGNIRELKNVIERAMILSNSTILYIDEPVSAHQEQSGSHYMADIERKHILDVLEKTGWRISGKNGAAEILGIKRTTLQSKIKALGITRNIS